MSAPRLIGFADSVYTRAARMGLHAKGVAFGYDEVNPFTDGAAQALAGLTPFVRVPVLRHGALVLYETAAIVAYIDGAFDGPELMPRPAVARAQVVQVQGIVDAHGYWPLVRQVYSHGFFRPHHGEPGDVALVEEGLARAAPVLDALDAIAAQGHILTGRVLTRADCHLAPMLDSFAQVGAGQAMLDARPALAGWLDAVASHAAFIDTRPDYFSHMGEAS